MIGHLCLCRSGNLKHSAHGICSFLFFLANGHPSYNNLSLMLFLDPQAKVLNKIKTMIYHPSAFLALNIGLTQKRF